MNMFFRSHPQQQQGIHLLQYKQQTVEEQDSTRTANQIPFNMSRHNPADQQHNPDLQFLSADLSRQGQQLDERSPAPE